MVTWNAQQWLEDKRKAVGQSGAHAVRLKVWANDLEVFREGGYTTDSGKNVVIGGIPEMLSGSRVYSEAFSVADRPVAAEGTRTGTGNWDCIELGKHLKEQGYNPVILNFSGIRKPNGLVDRGYKAQEEAICRRTNLTQALSQFYTPEWAATVNVPYIGNSYPLDSLHGSVYTPGVTVFRTGEKEGCRFLDEPFALSFISNGAIKKAKGNEFTEDDVNTTRERIRTVFRVGLDQGHDALILGGWGCGAFNNPVDVMAGLFKSVSEEDEFRGKYRGIFFACLEKSSARKDPTSGKFAPFYRLFGTLD